MFHHHIALLRRNAVSGVSKLNALHSQSSSSSISSQIFGNVGIHSHRLPHGDRKLTWQFAEACSGPGPGRISTSTKLDNFSQRGYEDRRSQGGMQFRNNFTLFTVRRLRGIRGGTMPCHATPCHDTPCHAMPRYAMPFLCHATPCHATPLCGNETAHSADLRQC